MEQRGYFDLTLPVHFRSRLIFALYIHDPSAAEMKEKRIIDSTITTHKRIARKYIYHRERRLGV